MLTSRSLRLNHCLATTNMMFHHVSPSFGCFTTMKLLIKRPCLFLLQNGPKNWPNPIPWDGRLLRQRLGVDGPHLRLQLGTESQLLEGSSVCLLIAVDGGWPQTWIIIESKRKCRVKTCLDSRLAKTHFLFFVSSS